MNLYISPAGNDSWSGTSATPATDASDGPLATIDGAIRKLRSMVVPGVHGTAPQDRIAPFSGPVTVFLRGGRYELKKTIVIGEPLPVPVVFKAYENEVPVLDGGRKVTGWVETSVNGVPAWETSLPEVKAGNVYFNQLFVNGRRAQRPRLPKKGYYRVGEITGYDVPPQELGWGMSGRDSFRAAPGDFTTFKNLTDVQVIALHFWIDERMPVKSYDPASCLVTSTRATRAPLVHAWGGTPAPYYLDNVFEGLTEPGEWYLDRNTGKCFYIPLPGETIETAEIFRPRLHLLLHVKGDAAAGRFIDWVSFEGITFEHSEWSQTGDPDIPDSFLCAAATHHERGRGLGAASPPQAAASVPGVVRLDAARNCSFTDCTFRHFGWYGLELESGCRAIRVIGNEFYDMGAGGIKINGGEVGSPAETQTGLNRITDNHLHELGRVFHAAVGVLARRTFQNIISHNHIHDLYYTAISIGWMWGYKDTITRDNYIEYNHLHDIGQGVISDMGGIYSLGPQPGTVIRNNLIHDIESSQYGGWAIYPDEGSSHILIENNVAYNTNCSVFHQHYGRENIVRNNILAFGNSGIVALSRAEDHKSFVMYRNIIVADDHFFYEGGYGVDVFKAPPFDAFANLFWDYSGTITMARNKVGGTSGGHGEQTVGWDDWRKNSDMFSVVADPKFADPANGDFTLAEDSPALALGFRPIDLTSVGPRSKDR
jgi:hypothetical protein